mgnify:CR=1 FL=1
MGCPHGAANACRTFVAGVTGNTKEKNMEIPSFIKSLAPEVAFALGSLQVAHENRAHYRERAKSATAELEAAKRDFNAFGMFDDCGPSYEASYSQAKGSYEMAVALKISSEKHYKKLKHEFLDAFPKAKDSLEALIPGANANTDTETAEGSPSA